MDGGVEKTKVRLFGRSGIQVSAIGLGCWAIGGYARSGDMPLDWGEVDDKTSIRAIHCALDLGINYFDTADVYGAGHAERLLGQALAGRREQAVISTKFGISYDETTRQVLDSCASPDYIRQACDRSLKRLNADYIDVYLFNLNWYPMTMVGPVLETLEELVNAGKIRAYGWSTDDPGRARVLAQGPHCTAVQFRLNVFDDHPEMIELCHAMDLAGINRSPLAMGLLTGKYQADTYMGDNDVRGKNGPGWVRYFKDGRPNRRFLKKIGAIREILTSNGRTLAQGALSWLLARSQLMIPIPGFRTVKQAEENASVLQFGPLGPDQMKEIDDLIRGSDLGRFGMFRNTRRVLGVLMRTLHRPVFHK